MNRLLLTFLSSSLLSLVWACSSEEAPAEPACGVGETCSCTSDSDCPDPVLEACNLAVNICLPRQSEPDVTEPDVIEPADVTEEVSSPDTVSDIDQELIDQVRDAVAEELIEENTFSCNERCDYAESCGAPDPFNPQTCAEECADLNGAIAAAYGDSPSGRACIEGIAFLDACLLALDCETFVQAEYGSDDEEGSGERPEPPCVPQQQAAATACNALFGEDE